MHCIDGPCVVVGMILSMWSSRQCLFFFSSRRRHTRFDCDWSSDVCSSDLGAVTARSRAPLRAHGGEHLPGRDDPATALLDRKSTRLNSSHSQISYAVFCLKKKKT